MYNKLLSSLGLGLLTLNLFSLDFVISRPTFAQFNHQIIAASPSTKITEAAVQEVWDKVTIAIEQGNLEEVLSYFAPFVTSHILIEGDNTGQIVKLYGIEDHRRYIEEYFKLIKSSEKPLFYDTQIRINPDQNMAFVRRTSIRGIDSKDGQKMMMSSDGEFTLAIVEGKLVFISIDDEIEVDPRPKI